MDFSLQVSFVLEIHIDRIQLIAYPGMFDTEVQDDLFVRLDTEDQYVGLSDFAGGAEQTQGRLLKVNADFGYALFKAFACAQIKRNACPSPVVYIKFCGKESGSFLNLLKYFFHHGMKGLHCC